METTTQSVRKKKSRSLQNYFQVAEKICINVIFQRDVSIFFFFSAMDSLPCPFPKPVFDNILLAVEDRIHEFFDCDAH